MNNTIILRLLFLIFVVVVAGFFIYENEKSSRQHIENFEEQDIDNFDHFLKKVDEEDKDDHRMMGFSSCNIHRIDNIDHRRRMNSSNNLSDMGSNNYRKNYASQKHPVVQRTLGNNVSQQHIENKDHNIESRPEYKFYDAIIKVYRDTLCRIPNVDELQEAASKINYSEDLDQLKKQLAASEEYNHCHVNDDTEYSSASNIGTDGYKQMTIKNLYRQIFDKEITFEILEFYMKKLERHDDNFEKIREIMEGVFTEQNAFSSIITDEQNALSYITNQRNLNALKYSCERMTQNKNYTESNLRKKYDDLVLIPGQEWSVPQKHPPICIATTPCEVRASTDQTALIGTLLDDL